MPAHEVRRAEQMAAPGVKSHIFKIDWLHALDQGTAADFIGNLFWLLLGKMEGANQKGSAARLAFSRRGSEGWREGTKPEGESEKA